MKIRQKQIKLMKHMKRMLAVVLCTACLLCEGVIPVKAAEAVDSEVVEHMEEVEDTETVETTEEDASTEEAADLGKAEITEESEPAEEVMQDVTESESDEEPEGSDIAVTSGMDMGCESIMFAAGSTMSQQNGIIRWHSSGTGSNNYKNTWRWRVVGWHFSFYRNGVKNLDYYYAVNPDTSQTTYYSLSLDDVMAETGADLKTGNMYCVANARIEFRHFNWQSVVDQSFCVDSEADANYYWRYFGMTPGTGQYGQDCPWESFYLTVLAGEGIMSTTGAGWYDYGTTVSYGGTCADGYFAPTGGSVYIDGNKQVTVTAKKGYNIIYNGNGATGGTVVKQQVTYGEWVPLNKNNYTKQYHVTYNAAGGMTEVPSQTADCVFRGWSDKNEFTLDGSTYYWHTFEAPFYANYNTDVRKVYGYDKEALLTHFVNYTVKGTETRRSSEVFQLSHYMINGGADLKKAFGNDRMAYLNHWNKYGYREHRNGGSMANGDAYHTYPNGANVKNLTNKAGGTVELTAEWTNPKITLPSATRDGYELLGWSKTEGLELPEYLPGEKVTIDKDTEFYAVWKECEFNVSYIGNEQDSGNDFTEYNLKKQNDYTLFHNLDGEEKHFTKKAVVSFLDSVSGEVMEENTTETVIGWSLDKDNKGAMYELDMIVSGAELYNAALEAGNLTEGAPATAYNTYPLGAAGSEPDKPSDAAEEYINLYAVWDCGAVIEAYDLYYTLEEAQAGKITMDELLSPAKAWDKEAETEENPDGILAYGADKAAGTNFTIEDYDALEFQNFTHEGSVTETYFVEDKAGNITRRQITVYIVDSSTGSSDVPECLDIRFISQEYLDTLKEDSVWRVDESYQNALTAALSPEGAAVAEWTLSHEEIENIKNEVEAHGFRKGRGLSNEYVGKE